MIGVILIISSPAWICPSYPSAEETAKKHQLIEMVGQDASQYQSCSTADDCYFMPLAGGHIVAISGLRTVSHCADRLSRRLFAKCYQGDVTSGVDLPEQKVPASISCDVGRCVGHYDENASEKSIRKMVDKWLSKYSKFLKQPRSKNNLDSLCEGFLRETAKVPGRKP